ncbi:MAG: hypothetical protein ABL896_12440 [Hylemonella sp.]
MKEAKEALFVMAQPATFTWPVKVRIPTNGKYVEAEVVVTFPNLDEEQLEKLLASKEKGGEGLNDREIARRVVLGFEPIPMPGDVLLHFTEENRDLFLNKTRASSAVVGTLIAVSKGVAAEKN